MVKGDGNHNDTVPACVTVEIKPAPTPEPEPQPEPSGRTLPVVEPDGKTALKVTWTAMQNVDGYDLFFTECYTVRISEQRSTAVWDRKSPNTASRT